MRLTIDARSVTATDNFGCKYTADSIEFTMPRFCTKNSLPCDGCAIHLPRVHTAWWRIW